MPPLPTSNTPVAAPPALSNVLVGDGHHIVDRPLAASADYLRHTLLVREAGYWRPSTADQQDAALWVADTLQAVGDVVIPATRPAAATVDATNTGDGAITVLAGANARAGLYEAVCIAEAGNGGTFRLIDPSGQDLGAVAVGATPVEIGGLTLTIADGSADWDKGDRIEILVSPLHFYAVTAIGGDGKTHATTEPTWPTDGTTVVDDAVTWQDQGVVDDLRTFADLGVLLHAEPFSVGAGPIPALPVVQSGQVSLAQIAGIPTAYAAGQWLGHLLLEV